MRLRATYIYVVAHHNSTILDDFYRVNMVEYKKKLKKLTLLLNY